MQEIPNALVFFSENVFVVQCPCCKSQIYSPFSERKYWLLPDLIIRQFQYCDTCRIKLRIPRGRGVAVKLPEWWEGLPTDEEEF